jgi:hypothetical protein
VDVILRDLEASLADARIGTGDSAHELVPSANRPAPYSLSPWAE